LEKFTKYHFVVPDEMVGQRIDKALTQLCS